MTAMESLTLAGRTIAVPETRELEVFASLLERRGARVLRCPMVSIRDAPDPQPVLAFARTLTAGGCDDLILTTGEGLRRLAACIDRNEPQLQGRPSSRPCARAQGDPGTQAGAGAQASWD